ncbi:MAG: PIN domain-containing protein [Candidatus Lokiarchaeota archaeon]|nr:PIN domain-containing protein [Candidatus Lokiarchaeota archaeon]
MYFIDANILLEVMLDQQNSVECIECLKNLEKGKFYGYINDFLLYSICLTIIYKTDDLDLVKKFLKIIKSFNNLVIYYPSISDLTQAISFMNTYKLDFDDSLVLSCMKSLKIKNIISFDKHFDNISQINRIEPSFLKFNNK